MIVDDEENIILATAGILEDYGYQVRAFTIPEKALDEFLENPTQFDLVITDMTMPGMTGAELARQILNAVPGKPIILCTGHSSLINREMALEMGISEYMEKPVITQDLARVVRTVLDGRS